PPPPSPLPYTTLFRSARVVTSSVHAHAYFGDHDKARMCERMARSWWHEELVATRGDYLFVGDSPNDQPCFAYFPIAAGVANVRRDRKSTRLNSSHQIS